MRWQSVDLVVRRHDTHQTRFLHRDLERIKEDITQESFAKVCRPDVGTAFRLAMRAEVFQRCHHVTVIDVWSISLKALNRSNAHTCGEVRIFAVSLFHPAPARIARDVEYG